MEIKFNNVSRSFGRINAVRDLSLTVPANKLVAVVGPSGSGKSTLLSLLTGLLSPDRGGIEIGGKPASGPGQIIIPPRQRQIGMVFQTLALWPHMTVRKNLSFVLKGKCPKSEMASRIDEILSLMGLSEYADTYPPNLSGGEQQRVALARALIIRPDIFLLDEPLSSLDRHLVAKLLPMIRRFHQEFKTTTIYVTHDQSEALGIADLVAVMKDGQLSQFDTPESVYYRPANRFVASFIGEAGILEGEVIKPGLVKTALGELGCIAGQAGSSKVLAVIRPENLKSDQQGSIKGRIISAEFKGENWLATISTSGDVPLYARFTEQPQINTSVTLSVVKPVWVISADR